MLEATRLVGLAQELPPRHAEADNLCGRGRSHVDRLVGHGLFHRGRVHLVAVDRLEGEPALVAQPTVVDRFRVDPEQPGQTVGGGLHGHPAPDRAGRAGRLDLVQVPRSSREAVGRRGQGAHRADLHGVATEVGGERLGRERRHLHPLAATGKVDLGFAGHLGGEPGAARALDTPFTIQQHQVRNGDRLLEVALLLNEAALARPVGQGLVLQRALTALVAHGAVERVVGEEELEYSVLRLLHLVRRGVDHHAVGGLNEAGRLERRPAGTVDFDQAHATHTHRLHARVVAESRDVGPGPLGRGDQQLARLGRHGAPVEADGDLSTASGLQSRGTRRP